MADPEENKGGEGAPAGAPDPHTDPEGYAAHMARIADEQGGGHGDPYKDADGNADSAADSKTGDDGEGGEKPTRPEHVPEKFWDAEKGEVRIDDLLKAHGELEKQFTKSRQEGGGKDDKGDKGGESEGESAEHTKSLQSAFEKANTDLTEKGDISDETVESLEKVGIPREMVDTYRMGLSAIQKLAKIETHGLVGGEDNYKEMIDWARDNLSEGEIAHFDREVLNPAAREGAVNGLWARFKLATGHDGERLTGHRNSGTGPDAYASEAEMNKDMADPRYATDPAFRKRVMDKVMRSDFEGSTVEYVS